jgi:hypothetical protein
VEMLLSLPMIIGELGFGIWLLLRGGKEVIIAETPVRIREFITNPAS